MFWKGGIYGNMYAFLNGIKTKFLTLTRSFTLTLKRIE